jgi:transcriptional regulator with XRE-family HTH domain
MTMSLGRRIKTRRVLCWLSQAEFGRRVGVSRRQIAYWESGSDAPSAESICRICVALSVSADWLLTGRGMLGDIHDQEFYLKQKARHLKRAEMQKATAIRLFSSLPLDFGAKGMPGIPVSPDDRSAIALRIEMEDYRPVYIPGDTLLLRPVNLLLAPDAKCDLEVLAQLHDKHVAVVLNGESSLNRLEVKPGAGSVREKRELVTRLHSITRGSSSTRVRKPVTLRNTDELLIQAAVYKCVRDI